MGGNERTYRAWQVAWSRYDQLGVRRQQVRTVRTLYGTIIVNYYQDGSGPFSGYSGLESPCHIISSPGERLNVWLK